MPIMQQGKDSLATLRAALTSEDDIELAVLIGSRTTGLATVTSDWDIAVSCPLQRT
jgi:predicted nucleotidyltransferase